MYSPWHPPLISCNSVEPAVVLQLNPIPTSSPWKQRQIPRMKAQSHRWLPTDSRCQLQVQTDTCASDGYKSGVPTTPALGWTNLLEWLEELRRTVCLPFAGSWCGDTVKDTGEHPDGREERAGMWEEGAQSSLALPGAPRSQHLHVFSKRCNWGFLWRLHCTGMMD